MTEHRPCGQKPPVEPSQPQETLPRQATSAPSPALSSNQVRGPSGLVFAVTATAIATLLRWALDPLLDDTAQFLFYYFSVVLVAVEAGLAAGLWAILLGAAAGTWLFVFLEHVEPGWSDEVTRLVLFMLFGGFTNIIAARLWRTRKESAAKTLELELSLESLRRTEKALRESERRYRIVAEYPYDWEFWRAADGETSLDCHEYDRKVVEEKLSGIVKQGIQRPTKQCRNGRRGDREYKSARPPNLIAGKSR